MQKRCKQAKPPIETKKKHQKRVKVRLGSQIVCIELLWRRGHADPNVSSLLNETEAKRVAKEIPDLKNEPSEIEMMMNSIGADAVFVPKTHFEIAGRVTDHVWGVSKLILRKENASLSNEQHTKNLKERVK